MSAIITQGYGPVNLIVTRGYGLFREIVERIVEFVTRFFPIGRKPFEKQVHVSGTKIFSLKEDREVYGDLVFKKATKIPIMGDILFTFGKKIDVLADYSSKFSTEMPLAGAPIHPVKRIVTILGDLVFPLRKKAKVTGKKDHREMIIEILEEEEE